MARILIAGAGVGGLALAQALRHAGFDVAVHERDTSPRVRGQGYRIHINADGDAALRACLPPEVMDAVREGSDVNGDFVGSYTHLLEPVMTQSFPRIPGDVVTAVDRNTFRRALLTGLDGIVHFGHTVDGYETDGDSVRVTFREGGGDEGDLLVAADGIGSAVRRVLKPEAAVRDLGLRCLYGRMPLTEETAKLLPEDFGRGLCWVAEPADCGAGFAPLRFRTPREDAADYLMTTLITTSERLGADDGELFALPPERLRALAERVVADWHPAPRDLFAHADPATFLAIPVRAGERYEPWAPGPVTMLGDAAHPMPPAGGVGANTALWDAWTLADRLRSPRTPLAEAVAAYEELMLPRGFATIDDAMAMARMMFGRDF